ncbi:hypothetical protein L2E82_03412 [Cichorium intybus]|uniref:Uncharacterized protein n=1 Tax=Cichorium intybus TaxID=13427 RepID=A0ACB9H560_CICIN|nr:hypothetical protein L2E82_03412 [Cichorium intybus]
MLSLSLIDCVSFPLSNHKSQLLLIPRTMRRRLGFSAPHQFFQPSPFQAISTVQRFFFGGVTLHGGHLHRTTILPISFSSTVTDSTALSSPSRRRQSAYTQLPSLCSPEIICSSEIIPQRLSPQICLLS